MRVASPAPGCACPLLLLRGPAQRGRRAPRPRPDRPLAGGRPRPPTPSTRRPSWRQQHGEQIPEDSAAAPPPAARCRPPGAPPRLQSTGTGFGARQSRPHRAGGQRAPATPLRRRRRLPLPLQGALRRPAQRAGAAAGEGGFCSGCAPPTSHAPTYLLLERGLLRGEDAVAPAAVVLDRRDRSVGLRGALREGLVRARTGSSRIYNRCVWRDEAGEQSKRRRDSTASLLDSRVDLGALVGRARSLCFCCTLDVHEPIRTGSTTRDGPALDAPQGLELSAKGGLFSIQSPKRGMPSLLRGASIARCNWGSSHGARLGVAGAFREGAVCPRTTAMNVAPSTDRGAARVNPAASRG